MESTTTSEKLYTFWQGGGEMGERICNYNWASTSLGPPHTWPQSLKTTLGIILHSKFPMFLFWGSQSIFFYNDAYRPSVENAGKHPYALGKSGVEVWPEIWADIYPQINEIFSGGEASWHKNKSLPIYRNGKLENAYWTYSYSPVMDENHEVAGVFVTCMEETKKVQNTAKLKDGKPELDFAIGATGAATWAYNPYTDKLSGNDECRKWFDLPAEGAISVEAALNAIGEGDQQRVKDAVQQALSYKSGGRCDIEFTIDSPGTACKRIVHAIGQALFTDEGQCHRFAGTLQDVTDRALSLKKIEESEEKYRSLFQSMDQGFCVFEMIFSDEGKAIDYRFLEINPVFEAQTGLKDAVGKTARELVPNLEAHWFDFYGRVALTGEAKHFVQGSEAMGRWFDVYAYRTGKPEARKVALLFTDITQRKTAEERLRRSEQNLRSTILQAPVAMCIFKGPNHIVEIANERMFEFWGKEGSAFVGKPIFEGLPEAKGQGFEDLLASIYKTGETVKAYGVPVTLPRNGVVETVYVDFVYEAYRDGENCISGVMAVAIEVTEQVNAQKQIEQSEQRFQNLIREANVGIVVLVGNEMRVSVVNTAYGRLINRTVEELYNKPLFDVIPDAEKPFRPLLEKVRLTGEPLFLFDAPYSVYTNGQKIEGYLNVVYQPYREEDGSITGVMALVQDVTEQVAARQKLEEAEERGRLSIEAGELGTVEVNLQTEDVIVSRRTEEIFGIEPGNLRTMFVSKIHLDDLRIRQKAYEKALQDGVLEYEVRVWKTDGSLRWIRAKGRVFFDEGKKPLRLVSVVQDITQEKAFAEELQKQVQERTRALAQSNDELQQFAHVASHDLKEPVRKIRTFGSRMRLEFDSILPDKAKSYLDKIESAATRMYTMIDGVLLYSSLNALQQSPEPVDLNEVMMQIKEDLEMLIQEKEADVRVGQLPTIEGSPLLLYQLFYNLLNNSLKFTNAGTTPLIKVNAEPLQTAQLSSNESYVAIAVKDNGIGFNQMHSSTIFDTFTRLNSKDLYEGTGLGLTLCKKIAERHGGTIRAEGQPGAGALFTVLLPIKQS